MTFDKETKQITSLAKTDSVQKILTKVLSSLTEDDLDKIDFNENDVFTLRDMVEFMRSILANSRDEIAFNFVNRIIEGIERSKRPKPTLPEKEFFNGNSQILNIDTKVMDADVLSILEGVISCDDTDYPTLVKLSVLADTLNDSGLDASYDDAFKEKWANFVNSCIEYDNSSQSRFVAISGLDDKPYRLDVVKIVENGDCSKAKAAEFVNGISVPCEKLLFSSAVEGFGAIREEYAKGQKYVTELIDYLLDNACFDVSIESDILYGAIQLFREWNGEKSERTIYGKDGDFVFVNGKPVPTDMRVGIFGENGDEVLDRGIFFHAIAAIAGGE